MMKELVYDFVIANVNHKKSYGDKKVRETILTMLQEFFRTNNEVIHTASFFSSTGSNAAIYNNQPGIYNNINFRFAAIYVHTPSQVYMFGDYWPIQWRWHQRVPVK